MTHALTKRARSLLAAIPLLIAATFSTPANAAPLFGLDSGGGGSAPLISIDPGTAVAAAIGSGNYVDTFGGFGVGLAYNGLTGVMYARSFDNLYTVDLNTGATTLVGASTDDITGLTFDSAFTTLYSVSQFNGNFFSVDPNTGAATLVGNTGVTQPLGLSTRSDGTVFGASGNGDVYSIDALTGVATVVATGLPGFTEIAFDENDVLYGISLAGDNLGIIDLVGGTFSSVGTVGFIDVRGLAFAIDVAAPEPGTLVLLAFGLAAGLGFRRRSRAC